jgi:hypothetical protein
VYKKFGLDKGTIDFIGHAMALYLNDEWVQFSNIKSGFFSCFWLSISIRKLTFFWISDWNDDWTYNQI